MIPIWTKRLKMSRAVAGPDILVITVRELPCLSRASALPR